MDRNRAMEMYDAVILGGGPGGYSAALRISQLGGKACLVEKKKLGGTCATVGCIPSKTLVSVARKYRDLISAEKKGIIRGEHSLDFGAVTKDVQRAIEKSVQGVSALLAGSTVKVVSGWGRIRRRGEVIVFEDDEKKNVRDVLFAKNVIIATGSKPIYPHNLPPDECIITSDDVLSLASVPASLVIVGGGYIGLEFASIFNTLGTKVTVIEMLPVLISTEEPAVSSEIKRLMERQGVTFLMGTALEDIRRSGEALSIKYNNTQGRGALTTERVLLAMGRRPNLDEEELREVGVLYSKEGVTTDTYLKTNIEGIYAIGDVNGIWPLAHVASAEGIVAAENIMGKPRSMDYCNIPNCIFTTPEIASVGIREGNAGIFPFLANGKAVAMGETEGFVKVYVKGGKLVGASIIGPHASDLIAVVQGFLGKETREIVGTVIAHPSLPEAIVGAVINAAGNG